MKDAGLASLDPRLKPEMTLPSICRGKGGSGPASGPTMSGRFDLLYGASDAIASSIWGYGELGVVVESLR